ncbi:MAG: hypothetical protein PHQ66_00685 [Candidatus Nanoarchaeia archaeon]|nr:hypothetical protein [Candidatus Nanoarchaeia archaeon]MDD5358506.1 hypothetical protein [Candidatus Nanoarchaeia archaeon]MDD5589020.1 hypothetical protein [Candidatus Nanoarchaeia archaeon]
MTEDSKKTADIYEKYAQLFLKEKNYPKATNAYENAGDYWEKKGEIRNAIKDYEDALRYVSNKEDQTRIKNKMEKLHFERVKILGRLEQMKQDIVTKKPRKGLRDKLYSSLSIASLAFALIFISLNLTGNAVGGITLNDSRWISICFFLCGLSFAFLYLKNKN